MQLIERAAAVGYPARVRDEPWIDRARLKRSGIQRVDVTTRGCHVRNLIPDLAIFLVPTQRHGQFRGLAKIERDLTKRRDHAGIEIVPEEQIGRVRPCWGNVGLPQKARAGIGTVSDNHFAVDFGGVQARNPAHGLLLW